MSHAAESNSGHYNTKNGSVYKVTHAALPYS
jgi:hypothetical protein